MRYLFIVLFLVCAGFLSAQTYVLKQGKLHTLWVQGNFFCKLIMKNDQYYISLSAGVSDDMVYTKFLSYGTFKSEGNLYFLKDIPTNAEIVIEKYNRFDFNVKKGFSFMKNAKFFQDVDYGDLFNSIVYIEKEKKRKEKRKKKPIVQWFD